MQLNFEKAKQWFGYNRKERRGSFVLLLIVILILILRVVIPEKNINIHDITSEILSKSVELNEVPITMQSFDPNSTTYDTLIEIGFSEREARTLISYRNKGGFFSQPTDIKKVYGLDEAKAEKIIPFVKVKRSIEKQENIFSSVRQSRIIDLNLCDSSALVTLPGIGPVLSVRIIKYRNLLGGFSSVNQLQEVYGLTPETFNIIKGRVFADSSSVRKININSAGYRDLSRFPYFEDYEIKAILKYRELQGRLVRIENLTGNKLITPEKARKISHYLRFD